METNKKTIRYAILGALGCVLLYWILHETDRVKQLLAFGQDLLGPFLVGACIAFILNVPMRAIEGFLQKAGLRKTRGLSILLTLACVVLVISFVINMLVPQIDETIHTIAGQFPHFVQRTETIVLAFLDENPSIMNWLVNYTDIENWDWASLAEQAVDWLSQVIKPIFTSAVSAVGTVFGAVWDIVISLIFSLYCLINKETLASQIRKLLYAFIPEKWADETIRIARLTNSTFSNFLSGQGLEVCILGSMFAIAMSIFRMPYVSLVSVLVAVTAFIPVVGAWIGCVLGAFFILVNDPMQAVWFVILFLVLQQIENTLIYPNVVGTSIGLPSMWVLCAVSLGGALMGVAGMLVMIPLTSVVYTLLREYSTARVQARGIDPEKLKAQPPELKSKFKEKREHAKKKRDARKAAELAQLMKDKLHLPEQKEHKE